MGNSRGLEPASDLLQTVRRRSGSPGMKKWVGDTYHAVSLSGPNRGEGSERNEARGQGRKREDSVLAHAGPIVTLREKVHMKNGRII